MLNRTRWPRPTLFWQDQGGVWGKRELRISCRLPRGPLSSISTGGRRSVSSPVLPNFVLTVSNPVARIARPTLDRGSQPGSLSWGALLWERRQYRPEPAPRRSLCHCRQPRPGIYTVACLPNEHAIFGCLVGQHSLLPLFSRYLNR